MLTDVIISKHPWFKNIVRNKLVLVFMCDCCFRGFSRICVRSFDPMQFKGRHYCSKRCRNRSHAYLANTTKAKQKREKTLQDRYGCVNAYNLPVILIKSHSKAAITKSHQTMKRNGSYGKSKPEDRLYEVLCELFGSDNVERQSWVHKWPIDFYVSSIDTYVQYDSYWHGFKRGKLRNIDEVIEYKNKRDVTIHKHMLKDVAQNEYFIEHNIKLVRVQNLKPEQITPDAIRKMGLL